MGDEIFSVYLTPADYSKLAYAKLDLPASPWKLLDALDKVRLSEGDSLYLEITEYRRNKRTQRHGSGRSHWHTYPGSPAGNCHRITIQRRRLKQYCAPDGGEIGT